MLTPNQRLATEATFRLGRRLKPQPVLLVLAVTKFTCWERDRLKSGGHDNATQNLGVNSGRYGKMTAGVYVIVADRRVVGDGGQNARLSEC